MEYTSKVFASMGNVTKKTLRHYNKLGLLRPSRIADNGYWYYNDDALKKLQLIKNLQILGFKLREIKKYMEIDFEMPRSVICEKKRYVDEQIIQLELAKKLLVKIENKKDLKVIDALTESVEEEHMEWLKENLNENQYRLVKNIFSSNSESNEHEKIVMYMKKFKKAYRQSERQTMKKAISSIKKIFYKYDLEEETIRLLIEFFLKASLEGPLSTRILSIKEVVKFMEML